MRATCRAAVAGLLAATAGIGTAQEQTPAPLDIRTGVYLGQPVTYEVIGGLAIVQGDIILGTPEELAPRDRQPAANALAAPNPDRRSDRAKLPAPDTTRDSAANTDPDTRWPDGVVAYVIDEDLYLPQRVHDAIEHWEEHTSIRFVERTDESNWVNFMKPDQPRLCASKIGMVGGEQDLSLADECRVAATIHEIGHAVGLWHEQEREDRDNHVMVLTENIDKRRLFNFMQDIVRQDDIGPYDYGSIMHYGAFDFSRNDQPAIETIPPGLVIGQRVGLSAGDIDAVSRLYGQLPDMTTISTNPEGLDVEVDGMTFTTPHSFDWTPGTSHTIGVPSTQGDDTERFLFAKWSDGGDREHTITASSVTTVFTAHFFQELQVESGARPPAGGTVTIEPPSDDGFYIARTPIEVTAVPAEGYAFGQWFGDLREQHHGSSGNPARVPSVPEDLNYTAIFTEATLTTIDTNVPGRWAVVDDDRVRLPRNFDWPSGSTHTIAIEDEPQPNRSGATRWVFNQWSDGGAATHEITVPDEPSTLTADFKQQFLLTTLFRESRGSVEVTPASDDDFHDAGSSVQLTAIPKVGFQFIAWIDENDEMLTSLRIARRRIIETADAKLALLRAVLEQRGPRSLQKALIYASAKNPDQFDQIAAMLTDLDVRWAPVTQETTANRPRLAQTLATFEDGGYQVLLAKKVLDEGVDIPSIREAFIVASSTVQREWIQRRGRVLRRHPEKPWAIVHDFLALPPAQLLRPGGTTGMKRIIRTELDRAYSFAAHARNAAGFDGVLSDLQQIRTAYWPEGQPSPILQRAGDSVVAAATPRGTPW